MFNRMATGNPQRYAIIVLGIVLCSSHSKPGTTFSQSYASNDRTSNGSLSGASYLTSFQRNDRVYDHWATAHDNHRTHHPWYSPQPSRCYLRCRRRWCHRYFFSHLWLLRSTLIARMCKLTRRSSTSPKLVDRIPF